MFAEVPEVSKIGDAKKIPSQDYRIGLLDLLEIKVLYADDIGRIVRVDSQGNISLPLIGLVRAAGLSTNQLEQSIAEKLAVDLVQNPQVTVFIKEFTSQRMTVQGVVNRAGVYEFQGQATLLQAISMAGGLMDKADESAIKIIRKPVNGQEQTLTFDLSDIRSNKAKDPNLENGDIVMVEEKQPISVQGAVKLPGIYYLRGTATLMQVLSQSGGQSEIADISSVRVTSTLENGKKINVTYDMDAIRDGKIKDPTVMPGDYVLVESSTAKTVVYGVTNIFRGFLNFGTVK